MIEARGRTLLAETSDVSKYMSGDERRQESEARVWE